MITNTELTLSVEDQTVVIHQDTSDEILSLHALSVPLPLIEAFDAWAQNYGIWFEDPEESLEGWLETGKHLTDALQFGLKRAIRYEPLVRANVKDPTTVQRIMASLPDTLDL